MRVKLAYGSTGLAVDLPGLEDEAAALRGLTKPDRLAPLAEAISPAGEVAVVFPDITRPMPSSRVRPVLLDEEVAAPIEGAGVARERIVLLSVTGKPRAGRAGYPGDAAELSACTPCQQAVWRAVLAIPAGQTRSYGWVAAEIGRPLAAHE